MDAGNSFTLNFSSYKETGGNTQDMSANALGLHYTSIATRNQAQASLAEIDSAVAKVAVQRSLLDSLQNRLSYSINALEITIENVSSAESRIRDAYMSAEISNFTKENIKSQAAQINVRANQVLDLLQNI